MEMIDGGKIIVSKGQSKIIQNNNIFKADIILYNRYLCNIAAHGNINIHLKIKKDEFIEAQGSKLKFCLKNYIGQLVGQQVKIKYFKKYLIKPYCTLYSDRIYFNKNKLKAYDNVQVITNFVIIKSNNVFFNNNTAIFKKNEKRLTAYILYNNVRVVYEADKILFCFNNNKMIMEGNIKGIIQIYNK
jgi:lipopolysaccharide export system protein LptA